jgi:hypothetical protein
VGGALFVARTPAERGEVEAQLCLWLRHAQQEGSCSRRLLEKINILLASSKDVVPRFNFTS